MTASSPIVSAGTAWSPPRSPCCRSWHWWSGDVFDGIGNGVVAAHDPISQDADALGRAAAQGNQTGGSDHDVDLGTSAGLPNSITSSQVAARPISLVLYRE